VRGSSSETARPPPPPQAGAQAPPTNLTIANPPERARQAAGNRWPGCPFFGFVDPMRRNPASPFWCAKLQGVYARLQRDGGPGLDVTFDASGIDLRILT